MSTAKVYNTTDQEGMRKATMSRGDTGAPNKETGEEEQKWKKKQEQNKIE